MIFYIFYAALGRLFIFLIQKSPYVRWVIGLVGWTKFRAFLEELFECDLCLGFWVYFFLALVFQYANVNVNLLDVPDVPILSAIITGAVTCFIVSVFVTGWKDRFGTFEIGG